MKSSITVFLTFILCFTEYTLAFTYRDPVETAFLRYIGVPNVSVDGICPNKAEIVHNDFTDLRKHYIDIHHLIAPKITQESTINDLKMFIKDDCRMNENLKVLSRKLVTDAAKCVESFKPMNTDKKVKAEVGFVDQICQTIQLALQFEMKFQP